MKKLYFVLLAVVLLLSLTSCGSERAVQTEGQTKNTESVSTTPKPTPEPTPEIPKVAYEITYSSFRLYKNSIGTVWGQAIVEFENTGTSDLYLSSGSYDIENSDGSLVAAKTLISEYPDVLKPGERGYLYDETTFEDLDIDAEYKMIPRIKAEAAKIDCVRFEISDFTLKEGYFGDLEASGRVINGTEENQNMIYVAAILFNSNNEPIGQMFTILTDDLEAGDKMGFEMSAFSMPEDITIESVSSYIVYSYPLQFQF